MNCQICNQPMKQIPAGVSKATGKPYSAFWACADKTHKQGSGFMQPGMPPVAKRQEPDWDAISRGKVRHGLVCAMIGAGWDDDKIKSKLLMYEGMVMNGTQTRNDFEEIPTVDLPF